METQIIERSDYTGVHAINPKHPKIKEVIIADTVRGDKIQIKGRLNAVWINDRIAGHLSKTGWGLQIRETKKEVIA